MSDVYLGLDLGTSGLKAALWSCDGELVAEAEAGYPVDRPRPGWAQSDTAAWELALQQLVAALAPALREHAVQAVGVAGQMHGLVLTDDGGQALAPALLWCDHRATDQLERWRELPAQQRSTLANPLVAGMTGPLLAWAAEHEPDLVARATHALLPKDVVRSLLVPSPVTDRSDASSTLLWDVPGDDWAHGLLEPVGVPARLLPEVRGSHDVVGHTDLLHELAGADRGVPVVAGAADAPAAVHGNGGGAALQLNIGSGAQAIAGADRPWSDPDPAVHLYADTGSAWYVMAALQNAGLALDWAAGVLRLSWAELIEATAATPPGAGGVVFLPFLEGERGAIAAPDARGGWLGAHGGTGRADLARAALEGVVFAMRRAVDLLPPEVVTSEVTVSGGGGRSPVVRQLLADVLDQPVQRREVRSASATGAAMLAAQGVGARLEPRRDQAAVTEPGSHVGAAAEAYERWTALVEREAM